MTARHAPPVRDHREPSRYHFCDEHPVEIICSEGALKLGRGWLAISEDEYAALSTAALPTPAVEGEGPILSLIKQMQGAAANYIEPTTYRVLFPADELMPTREVRMPDPNHTSDRVFKIEMERDKAFIGDILRLLDGPEQRAALSTPEPRAEGWRPMEPLPDVGRKFVALYDDGSGAVLAWRHDAGFISSEGDEFEVLKSVERWIYLPDDFEFWCESGDEPMTLRLAPASPQPQPGEE